MHTNFLRVQNLSLLSEGKTLLKDISFELKEGEGLVVSGPSGSGKTLLGKALAGLLKTEEGIVVTDIPSSERAFIRQQHDFRSLVGQRTYYQQRFDQNYGQSIPTVESLLHKHFNQADLDRFNEITDSLKLSHILKSNLIEISNGEGKRLQIALALIRNAKLLVFDNPFVGLDTASRQLLHETLNKLVEEGRLVAITGSEIPQSISRILLLKKGAVAGFYSKEEFSKIKKNYQRKPFAKPDLSLVNYSVDSKNQVFETAIELRNVSVSYGEKEVLKNISWKVRKGEKWALLGHNGAGKSTLLSLVNGDNPQVYKNEVYLFDKKRGSGESIWDIKKKIGYISPELHLFFQRSNSFTEDLFYSSKGNSLDSSSGPFVSCFEAVASGLNDQVGSSGNITSFQKKQVERWLEILDVKHLLKSNLYTCSLGEQRMVLLARALVKNPPLLILDEPCQGLDDEQVERFNGAVNHICNELDKTLIYVTHYKNEIPDSVDQVFVLENGRCSR